MMFINRRRKARDSFIDNYNKAIESLSKINDIKEGEIPEYITLVYNRCHFMITNSMNQFNGTRSVKKIQSLESMVIIFKDKWETVYSIYKNINKEVK